MENELERYAWGVMVAAHYKWEKNHGDGLKDQMDWYFDDIYKLETDQMVAKEVLNRLWDDYGPDGLDVIGVTEEQYVQKGLDNYKDVRKRLDNCKEDDFTEEELEQQKIEFAEEYRDFVEEYKKEWEIKAEEVREELEGFYHRFFNAPENLTVVYNGEVIQGK